MAISDPLTHLVRNSVDHGIEPPEERQSQGKPGHGALLLKAYYAAAQVVIEIKDDGRGIDGEQLAATAVAKGMISVDQANLMSAKEKPPLFDPAAPAVRDPEPRPERRAANRRQSPSSAFNIVVVTTGAFRYGLIVDCLLDSEEIVIKPLDRHLQGCHGYAGATIMGDGRIALILNIVDLAQRARLTSLEGSRRASELVRETLLKRQDRQALLIFRSAREKQFAVPLSLVERVEKINRCQIEAIGSRRVMQYRGGSLPLFSVEEAAAGLPLADQDNLLVIVFNLKGKDVGLLASGPVDAIEVSAEIDAVTLKQTGIRGSAIIGGTTTMLIDIIELVDAQHPEWFEDASVCGGEDAPHVRIDDDSELLRTRCAAYLEQADFPVLEKIDGLHAWQALESDHETIGLVVADIEMPNLGGFELTQREKHSSRFGHMPVTRPDHPGRRGGHLSRMARPNWPVTTNREKIVVWAMMRSQGNGIAATPNVLCGGEQRRRERGIALFS
jgi:two-component system chemotaxis sensor kinase CheA